MSGFLVVMMVGERAIPPHTMNKASACKSRSILARIDEATSHPTTHLLYWVT